MQAPADPLAQLHDILLPDAIGWWPLAPGWWALLVFLLALIATAIFYRRRKTLRNHYRQQALAELFALDALAAEPAKLLQAYSVLLRRTALTAHPRQFPVDIKGEAWLAWLDHYCPETGGGFFNGSGKALLTGPYQKTPAIDFNELRNLAETWIRKHRNQWQSLPGKTLKNSGGEHA